MSHACQVVLLPSPSVFLDDNTSSSYVQVDERVFRDHLKPVLGAAGLRGRFRSKCGSTREGGAVFYRKGRFEVRGLFALGLGYGG